MPSKDLFVGKSSQVRNLLARNNVSLRSWGTPNGIKFIGQNRKLISFFSKFHRASTTSPGVLTITN